MEEYLGEMDEAYLGQVEGESLARDMLDHAYHHRCCKSKSRDDLVDSMSEKMSSNDVWYPIQCHRDTSVCTCRESVCVENQFICASIYIYKVKAIKEKSKPYSESKI